jgi:hypothetical protein
MKIPDKVKIGGHTLAVIITNDCDNIAYNEIGKTCLAKNVIWLNKNYPKSRQEEALLHEMVHNMFYDLGEEQNEAIVERIGKYLYMSVIDNPEIFKEGDINV